MNRDRDPDRASDEAPEQEPDGETAHGSDDVDALAGGEFTDELSASEAEADRASGATEGAPGAGGGRLGDS